MVEELARTLQCKVYELMPQAARAEVWTELRGSQGMGVVSSNWLDRVLLSTLSMFKPSC